MRRCAVAVDRRLEDALHPLRDRRLPGQEGVHPRQQLAHVAPQREDVELLLVPERRIEAGTVETRSSGEIVQRRGGEALLQEHPPRLVESLPGLEGARPPAGAAGHFCTGSQFIG